MTLKERNKQLMKENTALVEKGELLALLREALAALNIAPRFNVGKTTSYRIAADIERAFKKYTGGSPY